MNGAYDTHIHHMKWRNKNTKEIAEEMIEIGCKQYVKYNNLQNIVGKSERNFCKFVASI